jgi:hypothetical protein
MSNAIPFWASTLQDLSIDIKSATSHGVLTPQNAFWSFESPFGTATLTNSQHGSSLGSVRVHSLTLFALPGACDMTPGSTYRPATLQPPCLGREPRLGLRHQAQQGMTFKTTLIFTFYFLSLEQDICQNVRTSPGFKLDVRWKPARFPLADSH